METDRVRALTSRLFEYVKSPSLRHIRDPHSIHRLAEDLLRAVDRAGSIWSKWDGPRDEIAKSAAHCWIPVEDLQAYLNQLPGPHVTKTDVVQRLRAVCEQPYSQYPDEEVKASCLALYEAEKAQGTEMAAIIGALQEHIEAEQDRLSREREEGWRQRQREERLRKQQLFEAGADSAWIQLEGVEGFHCRRNGRTYRVVRDKDKRWQLSRVKAVGEPGAPLGTYQNRRDASKALEKIAFSPEPQW
jgi:hypothetical protein